MHRLIALLIALALAACGSPREAGPVAEVAPSRVEAPFVANPPQVAPRAYAAIVVDARTGKVLHQNAANALRYPASLTKMMTLFLLFEELEAGRLSAGSRLIVSETASNQPPAKIGVKPSTAITVDTAARALAVRSANDVAVVIAENLAGSEEAFARRMTQRAREIGMTRTVFVNASGLPDAGQITTARDMAILGRALATRFPREFNYFSTRDFTFGKRKWKNTNKLLTKVRGMDGIKTGYIRASGYNLAASVRRDGRHVIAVVFGGKSGTLRNAQMEALIEANLPKASRAGLMSMF